MDNLKPHFSKFYSAFPIVTAASGTASRFFVSIFRDMPTELSDSLQSWAAFANESLGTIPGEAISSVSAFIQTKADTESVKAWAPYVRFTLPVIVALPALITLAAKIFRGEKVDSEFEKPHFRKAMLASVLTAVVAGTCQFVSPISTVTTLANLCAFAGAITLASCANAVSGGGSSFRAMIIGAGTILSSITAVVVSVLAVQTAGGDLETLTASLLLGVSWFVSDAFLTILTSNLHTGATVKRRDRRIFPGSIQPVTVQKRQLYWNIINKLLKRVFITSTKKLDVIGGITAFNILSSVYEKFYNNKIINIENLLPSIVEGTKKITYPSTLYSKLDRRTDKTTSYDKRLPHNLLLVNEKNKTVRRKKRTSKASKNKPVSEEVRRRIRFELQRRTGLAGEQLVERQQEYNKLITYLLGCKSDAKARDSLQRIRDPFALLLHAAAAPPSIACQRLIPRLIRYCRDLYLEEISSYEEKKLSDHDAQFLWNLAEYNSDWMTILCERELTIKAGIGQDTGSATISLMAFVLHSNFARLWWKDKKTASPSSLCFAIEQLDPQLLPYLVMALTHGHVADAEDRFDDSFWEALLGALGFLQSLEVAKRLALKKLTFDNVAFFLDFACTHNLQSLVDKCTGFIEENGHLKIKRCEDGGFSVYCYLKESIPFKDIATTLQHHSFHTLILNNYWATTGDFFKLFHPGLKVLRLEDCFGIDISSIVERSPNIRELVLDGDFKTKFLENLARFTNLEELKLITESVYPYNNLNLKELYPKFHNLKKVTVQLEFSHFNKLPFLKNCPKDIPLYLNFNVPTASIKERFFKHASAVKGIKFSSLMGKKEIGYIAKFCSSLEGIEFQKEAPSFQALALLAQGCSNLRRVLTVGSSGTLADVKTFTSSCRNLEEFSLDLSTIDRKEITDIVKNFLRLEKLKKLTILKKDILSDKEKNELLEEIKSVLLREEPPEVIFYP